jgi:hypothetical protein
MQQKGHEPYFQTKTSHIDYINSSIVRLILQNSWFSAEMEQNIRAEFTGSVDNQNKVDQNNGGFEHLGKLIKRIF